MMDNAEEVMHLLEEFSKMKPKIIPRELDDYLGYVAKTGNPLFKWSLVKSLFREKMLNVINDFYEDTLTIDLPHCPNVDVFNYDRMKSSLLERLETFHGAPFTVQRICELLTNPRKEYNRADKFMRAIEKNILVVSTREPDRYSELDCESTQECSVNGVQDSNDVLDSNFACNDLGSGPDSSSQNSEAIDSMDSNQNTVERISPNSDPEVSSDCDDSIHENSVVREDESVDKSEIIQNDTRIVDEENEVSNVSSTNVPSLADAVTDPVTTDSEPSEECNDSSSESVNSIQDYQVTSDLNEEKEPQKETNDLISDDSNSTSEDVESCVLPETPVDVPSSLPETELVTAIENEIPPVTPETSEVKVFNTITETEKTDETSEVVETVANIATVECDTSEGEKEETSTENIDNNEPFLECISESSIDNNEQISTSISSPDSESMNIDTEEISAPKEQTDNTTCDSSEAMEVDECQTAEKDKI